MSDDLAASDGPSRPALDCPASLNLRGEHFGCDWPSDFDGRHEGWAHTNKEVQAVWVGSADDARLIATAIAVRSATEGRTP